ncbi:hypothetical protein [Stenotrophomonas sp. ATs4]|uniref:hypothetical protein n=1 Tax=Stenotrophomonas sp. ATs4 TaxID=3402766 RepID=UPI003F727DDE
MTTDNKTLAVDVLAVMLDDAQKAKRHRMTVDAEYADDAEEESEAVRAAVAEMLSALQVAELALRERGLRACGEYKQIEAALARVKGESA